MKKQNAISIKTRRGSIWLRSLCTLLLLSLLGVSCNLQTGSSIDPSLAQTQMALGVQQTMLAQQVQQNTQGTIDAQQATIIAQAAPATQLAMQAADLAVQAAPPTVDTAATQVALAVQATLAAQSAANPPPAPADTQAPPPEPVAPAGVSDEDFKAMMKSASILVYEDIVNIPRLTRYVKKTLDGMGLKYKDDGSAKGWLKSDLLAGGPDGKSWDLIILALEARAGVSGEYFTYVQQALNQGSSVIIEVWYLDQISGGEVGTILSKCGVDVYRNFTGKTRTVNDIIMWPLPDAPGHPWMSDPNGRLTFTDAIDYWSYDDLGDLLENTGRGDAQLLLGTLATDANTHGTLAVCMDGQLTLQTFSSHSFPMNTMTLLWENYIVNALKVKLLGD